MKMRQLITRATAAVVLVMVSAAPSSAAPGDLTVLHPFSGGALDGRTPMGAVIESGGWLYGLSPFGGASNFGCVYRMNTVGGSFTNLHGFTGPDGKYPLGSLLLYNGKLYGMTSRGGSNDAGVVFEVATNGAGFAVRHWFNDENANDGAAPWGGLIQAGGVLYGMTYNGGLTNRGVIFSINASTWAYTNLHRFGGPPADGKHPKGDLLLDGNRLYGMASEGGTNNNGVIFSLASDGSGYRVLREFTGHGGGGANPSGALVKDGSLLYGMTPSGDQNAGVVFCVSTNGETLNYLRIFNGTATDGAAPYGSLLKHDTKLYGLTRFGGTNSSGVIFSLGGNASNQYVWPGSAEPAGSLFAVGDTLYGTAMKGGGSNFGVVFKFDASTGDVSAAWMAMNWIDNGGMGTSLEGDENPSRMYVRHNTAGGLPEYSFIGYGLTPNVDDRTWTWLAMTNYGVIGSDVEFTGSIGRASAGGYYVSAKFIKGAHVYYPQSAFGSWGDWNTQLFATNRWFVTGLIAPSNVYARYMSTNRVDVHFDGDGAHWVIVFRKSGASPEFTPAVDGTSYFAGTDYGVVGECVFRGSASVYAQTNLVEDTIYHYRLYTENYAYYSTGSIASASTDAGRDDDGDAMPNQYEVGYGFNPGTSADGFLDGDTDGALNWTEYIAGTDPTNIASVFEITDRTYTNSQFVISWSSVAGKQYCIYRTTNLLNGVFTKLATNLVASPPGNAYTDSVSAATAYFYNVKVNR